MSPAYDITGWVSEGQQYPVPGKGQPTDFQVPQKHFVKKP